MESPISDASPKDGGSTFGGRDAADDARNRGRPVSEMHPNGVSVELSPFIPSLGDGVTAALRELLGIPAHLPFAWHDKRVEPWRMEIKVGDLDLQLHDPGSEPALFAGDRLAFAYRGDCGPRGGASAGTAATPRGAGRDAHRRAQGGLASLAAIRRDAGHGLPQRVGYRGHRPCRLPLQPGLRFLLAGTRLAGSAARDAGAMDRRDGGGWRSSSW